MVYINFIFLFPFISLGLLNTDTQPFSFVAGLVCFLIYGRLIRYFVFFSLPIIGLCFSIMISDLLELETIVRAVVIYCTPIIISHAVFFSLGSGEKLSDGSCDKIHKLHKRFVKIVLFSVWVNFFVGAVQVFISRDFFKFLVVVRSSLERGVTGLTPEPSMYGITLILLGILIYCMNLEKRQKKILSCFTCISAFVFFSVCLGNCYLFYHIINLYDKRKIKRGDWLIANLGIDFCDI